MGVWTRNSNSPTHIPLGRYSSIERGHVLMGTLQEPGSSCPLFYLGFSGPAIPAIFYTPPATASLPEHLQQSPVINGLHTWGIHPDILHQAFFCRDQRPLPLMVQETECMEFILLQCGLISMPGVVSNEALETFISLGQYSHDSILLEFGWSPSTFKTRWDWFKRGRRWVKEGRTWVQPSSSSPGSSSDVF